MSDAHDGGPYPEVGIGEDGIGEDGAGAVEPNRDATAESFGDDRVDAAVDLLGGLRERAVSEHVGVFDDIHARLLDALEDAAVETGPEHRA